MIVEFTKFGTETQTKFLLLGFKSRRHQVNRLLSEYATVSKVEVSDFPGDNCVQIRKATENNRGLSMVKESTEAEQAISMDHDGWLSIADVKPTKVKWLGNPYIPLGKLTLFD